MLLHVRSTLGLVKTEQKYAEPFTKYLQHTRIILRKKNYPFSVYFWKMKIKIFGEGKSVPKEVLEGSVFVGGAAALANKLKNEFGWDGVKLRAVVVLTVEGGSVVDSHWSIFGRLNDLRFPATSVWVNVDKDLKVVVKMEDLSMFTFPGNTHLSQWLDRDELEVGL